MLGTKIPMEDTVGNDIWAKETAEKPDPKLPILFGAFVLVRPLAIPEKLGSIYMPDTARSEYQYLNCIGKVIGLGDQAYKIMPDGTIDEKAKPKVKVGDYVVYGRYAGEKFRIQEVNCIYIRDTHIRMSVKNPNDIIPGVVTGAR